MSKQDLTMYGEQELSLVVNNNESLYNGLRRCDDADDLRRLCQDFKYTDEQFEELESDLEYEQEQLDCHDPTDVGDMEAHWLP